MKTKFLCKFYCSLAILLILNFYAHAQLTWEVKKIEPGKYRVDVVTEKKYIISNVIFRVILIADPKSKTESKLITEFFTDETYQSLKPNVHYYKHFTFDKIFTDVIPLDITFIQSVIGGKADYMDIKTIKTLNSSKTIKESDKNKFPLKLN